MAERHNILFSVKEGSKQLPQILAFFDCCYVPCRWYISEYGFTLDVDLTAAHVRLFLKKFDSEISMGCDVDHCADSKQPDFVYLAEGSNVTI